MTVLSIVIPAYNEERGIEEIASRAFSPAILYNFASSFREKGFPPGTRFAVVPTRLGKMLQLGCRIARETGTHMRAFTDLRLALEWLFERISTSELKLQT